jgi:hypothetical protein
MGQIASHDTAVGADEARRLRNEHLTYVRCTPEGRAAAARGEVMQRIGSQILELLRTEYELDTAAIQVDDLAARRVLRERSRKVREMIDGLQGEQSCLGQLIQLEDYRGRR